MRDNKKTKFFLFSAMLISGFAAGNPSTVDGFSFKLGPAVKGQPLKVHFEFDNLDYPKYEFYYTLYTDSDKTTMLYQTTKATGTLSSSYPRFVSDSEIPSYYTSAYESCYLVLSASCRATTFGAQSYPMTASWNIKQFGDTLVLSNPQKETVIDTYRWCVNFDNWETHRESDLYRIGTWSRRTDQNQYHGLNISSFTIGYHGGVNNSNVLNGSGDIYIFTHPEDWPIFPVVEVGGKKAVKIPIKLNSLSNWTDENGNTFKIYSIKTKIVYSVSRIDYTMHLNEEETIETFKSSDIFIPLRTGHENAVYKCRISLYDLTEYKDAINVDFQMNTNGQLFGNCEDADYCVVLG